MWTTGKNFTGRGCVTPPTRRPAPRRSPLSERKTARRAVDFFHVKHKVPPGDSPYVKAKRAQLIDKDFGRAVGLFWAAINAGDRVDSALKDMAIVMKQLNRSDEAIEAIKSFRHLCPVDSQESLDNILIELYKRSGRIEEEVQMLQEKLSNIEDRKCCYSGSRFKTARSQGKKIQVTVEEERSRIMGNLAWAHIQMNNFETAEKLYRYGEANLLGSMGIGSLLNTRKALCLKQDTNKQCNLAICLMRLNKVLEARALLHAVGSSCSIDGETEEPHMKSYERALDMLNELEGERSEAPGHFTPPFAQDGSVSRAVSDQFGRGEETCVINEEKRRSMSSGGAKDGEDSGNFGLDRRKASPFETSERQSSGVCKAVNSAPRVPVRRNIGFSSMDLTNGAPLQPSHSIPLLNEHKRYSILGSPKSSAGVISSYSLENDTRKAYKMNEEGKWVLISGTEEEKIAGSKTKDLLAHWSARDKPKKSWADIAEEEEEEEEEEEDYFDDNIENVDANVMQHYPRSQTSDELHQRVALFGLEESKNAVSVRRSLKFDSNESCHADAEVQEQKRVRPRKRLPVFRDITQASSHGLSSSGELVERRGYSDIV